MGLAAERVRAIDLVPAPASGHALLAAEQRADVRNGAGAAHAHGVEVRVRIACGEKCAGACEGGRGRCVSQ